MLVRTFDWKSVLNDGFNVSYVPVGAQLEMTLLDNQKQPTDIQVPKTPLKNTFATGATLLNVQNRALKVTNVLIFMNIHGEPTLLLVGFKPTDPDAQ
ncbi:hypothetical protein FACS189472_00800 [Alphaproteobacteria bacterium]|nr:hypothetical protein FACS189472_00800 [Alphaproteobacteria bacterium]